MAESSFLKVFEKLVETLKPAKILADRRPHRLHAKTEPSSFYSFYSFYTLFLFLIELLLVLLYS
jgi:hypothetical protein